MRLHIIALEPPGNVARDLALYRRELFARLGEGSALAFPEILPLAVAAPAARPSSRRLAECWRGIEGPFFPAGLIVSGGFLYLSIGGPLEAISSRASAALCERGAPSGQPGLGRVPEAGIGLFLCSPADPELALMEAARIGPPSSGFLDCSLVLLGLDLGPRRGSEPFTSLTWRVLARARRRTGAAPS